MRCLLSVTCIMTRLLVGWVHLTHVLLVVCHLHSYPFLSVQLANVVLCVTVYMMHIAVALASLADAPLADRNVDEGHVLIQHVMHTENIATCLPNSPLNPAG